MSAQIKSAVKNKGQTVSQNNQLTGRSFAHKIKPDFRSAKGGLAVSYIERAITPVLKSRVASSKLSEKSD